MDSMVPEYQFPELYYESYLELLVRDPHCIFAYWELSPDIRKELKQQSEGNREQHIRLRVFDLTGLEDKPDSPHTYIDIAVHPIADNYFIKDLEANRSYWTELGITLEDGSFFTLLRSRTVHTPRNSVAENSPLMVKEILTGEVKGRALLIGSFASKGIYGDSMG